MATQVRRTHFLIALLASWFDAIKTDFIAEAGNTGTPSATGTAGGPTHTHTPAAITEARHVRVTDADAPETTAGGCTLVTDVQLANGALSLAAQPDVPRKLNVVFTEGGATITAGTLAFVGVGARGQAVTQTINLAGGSRTVKLDEAFATITSATVADLAPTGDAGNKVAVGQAVDLGLPGPSSPTPTGFAVFKAAVDGAPEAVGTVDATAGTISPTTAPNGTRDFDFWYRCTVQQAATGTPSATVAIPSSTHTHTKSPGTCVHRDRDERAVTAATASSLATSLVLTKALLIAYAQHRVDVLAHVAADTTNTVASTVADVVDLASAITAANLLRTAMTAHGIESGVHVTNDAATDVTGTPVASDQASLNTLLNAMKTALNAHFLRGLTAPSWRVID